MSSISHISTIRRQRRNVQNDVEQAVWSAVVDWYRFLYWIVRKTLWAAVVVIFVVVGFGLPVVAVSAAISFGLTLLGVAH